MGGVTQVAKGTETGKAIAGKSVTKIVKTIKDK